MQREVLLRRALRNGTNQLIKATVLSERGDTLRVVRQFENRPIEVKASDVVKSEDVYATRMAAQRGILVQKAYPDSTNSLCTLLRKK